MAKKGYNFYGAPAAVFKPGSPVSPTNVPTPRPINAPPPSPTQGSRLGRAVAESFYGTDKLKPTDPVPFGYKVDQGTGAVVPKDVNLDRTGLDYFRDAITGEGRVQQDLLDQSRNELVEGAINPYAREIDRLTREGPGRLYETAEGIREQGNINLDEIRARINATENEFVDETDRTVVANMTTVHDGINREIDRVQADPNLSAGEKRAMIAELENNRRMAAVQTTQSVRDQFNQSMAQLRTAGTQILADAGERTTQSLALAGQFEQAGLAYGLEVADRYPQLFQMIAAAPRQMISQVSGMMSLLNIATAPGGEQALSRVAGIETRQGNAREIARFGQGKKMPAPFFGRPGLPLSGGNIGDLRRSVL